MKRNESGKISENRIEICLKYVGVQLLFLL